MNDDASERIYYDRQMRLPGFGIETQEKLRNARVLIVGLGGLGCPIALYLAGAGIGNISLCDGDVVSVSNLHRQLLFDVGAIGQRKVDFAASRLSTINPFIKLTPIPSFADSALLADIVPMHDLVVDATDNFSAKYAISDACEFAKIPMIYGSISQFEGQISVFHHPTKNEPKGLSYRDLYPDAPPAGLTQNCGEAGVIGVLPGIVGMLQANEAIKIISGIGDSLAGNLLIFDALTTSSQKFSLSKRAMHDLSSPVEMCEISCEEFLSRTRSVTPPLVIDVRDAHERETKSLGGEHVPLATLPNRLDEFRGHRQIVLYCQSGVRSAKAALYLRSVLSDAHIATLKGGIGACANLEKNCPRLGSTDLAMCLDSPVPL